MLNVTGAHQEINGVEECGEPWGGQHEIEQVGREVLGYPGPVGPGKDLEKKARHLTEVHYSQSEKMIPVAVCGSVIGESLSGSRVIMQGSYPAEKDRVDRFGCVVMDRAGYITGTKCKHGLTVVQSVYTSATANRTL